VEAPVDWLTEALLYVDIALLSLLLMGLGVDGEDGPEIA